MGDWDSLAEISLHGLENTTKLQSLWYIICNTNQWRIGNLLNSDS